MKRPFIFFALLIGTRAFAADEVIDRAGAKPDEKTPSLLWYDVKAIGLEGKAFADTKAPFDRLPARAEGKVRPPVWNLSRNSAGIAVHFVTDATALHARWTTTSASLAMGHMPATGVSGLDLYVRHEGKWRWLAVGRPTAQTNTALLTSGLPAGKREFLLYLPLYNGVSSVEVGVDAKAVISKAPSWKQPKPIVFYGTSITQGGCASRPGMVHTAILGRRLESAVVNLGFSGNGTMDPSVTVLMGEIDASVFVIDCLPNMNAAQVAERTKPLVTDLRKARPDTPILLVEDRSYSDSFLQPSKRSRNLEARAALKKAFDELTAAGVKGLFYLEGEKLLGDDNEGTVDSSHPTDLGFVRQADAFEPALRKAMAAKN